MSEMRSSDRPEHLVIEGVDYDFLQTRISGGAVYSANDKSSYLRIGESLETAAEHIHLVSLGNRGYPVGKVLTAGKWGTEYYYVEESLGTENFGRMFGAEFAEHGRISDETFGSYIEVLDKYLRASFDPREAKHAQSNVRSIAHAADTIQQYGLDEALLNQLLDKCQARLDALPRIEMHADLGPFNTMPGGVIDFEMSEIGPVGYDMLAGMITGYYFPKTGDYYQHLLYEFDDAQYQQLITLAATRASEAGLPPVTDYLNDMFFLRTLWAAARPLRHEFVAYEEPTRERFWSQFRATILAGVVEKYQRDQPINPRDFPVIGLG